jgi:hypothetical protein
MESHESKYKEILIRHIPIEDLIKIIISYTPKYKIQYEKSIDNDVPLFNGNNIIKYYEKNKSLKKITYPKGCTTFRDIIDDNKILIETVKEYQIYDMKMDQIIITIKNNKMIYATSNIKYIVFIRKNQEGFNIFNIEKKNLYNVSSNSITCESAIINNILYITSSNTPVIYKYCILTGEYVGEIFLQKYLSYNWPGCLVKILDNEIIIRTYEEIAFYDLNGQYIYSCKLNGGVLSHLYHITYDYIYIHNFNKINVYKRIL